MHTLLLGQLAAPAKYRKYIAYLQGLQNEGRVYDRQVVDGLIDRFIEIANDNQHIKDLHAKKSGLGGAHPLSEERLAAVFRSLQRSFQDASADSLCSPKAHSPAEYVDSASKPAGLSLAMQALQIQEDFSALTAHTLSILLIIAEIEDLLKLTQHAPLHENIRQTREGAS